MAHDIRQQYTIGYHSTKAPSLGGFRAVRVVAKAKGYNKLIVRTKTGYYPNYKPAGQSGANDKRRARPRIERSRTWICMTSRQHGFSTRAIHDGQSPDSATGAISVPIYATSTYAQEEIGKNKGYEYSRASNPTRDALEQNLASLESGASAQVFSSGMAAISALVTMLKSGDHVVCGQNVYGGTPRLFNRIVANYGIRFSYVDSGDPESVARALQPNTKLVHIETPSNPLVELTDIRAVAGICHERNIDLSVDNTFMSPYLQRPIELGADIVMHSTTKFLNGHSDGLGGVLVSTKPEHRETFRFVQKTHRRHPVAFRMLSRAARNKDLGRAHAAA